MRGEASFLFGPSGSGKTTLLNAIAGIVGARKMDRRAIGYVMHASTLLPWLTIANNIKVEQRLRERKCNIGRMLKFVEEFGLPRDVLATRSWELSFGMRQRVEIAKALAFEVDLLLMDEALSGIDEVNKNCVLYELDSYLAERGGTVVSITHDVGDLARLADRVIVIKGGVICDDIRIKEARSERLKMDPLAAARLIRYERLF